MNIEEPRKFRRQLPCALPPGEWVRRSEQLAAQTEDLAVEENRVKAEQKAKKLEDDKHIAELAASVKKLANEVRTRTELLDVDCQEEPRLDVGKMVTIRCDTGEILSERAMTFDERESVRQLELALDSRRFHDAPPPAPPPAGATEVEIRPGWFSEIEPIKVAAVASGILVKPRKPRGKSPSPTDAAPEPARVGRCAMVTTDGKGEDNRQCTRELGHDGRHDYSQSAPGKVAPVPPQLPICGHQHPDALTRLCTLAPKHKGKHFDILGHHPPARRALCTSRHTVDLARQCKATDGHKGPHYDDHGEWASL